MDQPEVKAKIAIVNDAREILILTRSELEDTRVGEYDLPGGTLDPTDIQPDLGVVREAGEELPGTIIRNVTELDVVSKFKEGGRMVITHIFGGTAIFPRDGIGLSPEHSAWKFVPLGDIGSLDTPPDILPKKYRRAIENNPFIFDWLIQQALDQWPNSRI